MTTPPTPAPADPPPVDPPPVPLFATPEHETAFNAAVEAAVKKITAEQTPAPPKTQKPTGLFDGFFRS